MKFRVLSLFLLVALLVSFAVACKPLTDPKDTAEAPTGAPTEAPTETAETPVTPVDITVYTMCWISASARAF